MHSQSNDRGHNKDALVGIWCNGNTTDSGPVIPGSSRYPNQSRVGQRKLKSGSFLFSVGHNKQKAYRNTPCRKQSPDKSLAEEENNPTFAQRACMLRSGISCKPTTGTAPNRHYHTIGNKQQETYTTNEQPIPTQAVSLRSSASLPTQTSLHGARRPARHCRPTGTGLSHL